MTAPARASPATGSRAGVVGEAVAQSSARTAKPSISELSQPGSAHLAITGRDKTRPRARSRGTSSSAVTRDATRPSSRSWAWATGISGPTGFPGMCSAGQPDVLSVSAPMLLVFMVDETFPTPISTRALPPGNDANPGIRASSA